MAAPGSGYDLSASTFSPDGRIFQIEYASKAVEHSGTTIGLKCNDGIVLCVEKPYQSKMMLADSSRRLHTIDTHSGMAITGFMSDGRQIVNRAREEASNYVESYGSQIPPSTLADRVGAYIHYFTLHGSLRPFGVTALLASYDSERKEPHLHMIEPSGVNYQYYGCAAGNGRQAAKTELEKLSIHRGYPNETLDVRQGVKKLARIILMLHDETKDRPFELEMSWLCAETGWKHRGVPREFVKDALEWAKNDLEEVESSDESGEELMEE